MSDNPPVRNPATRLIPAATFVVGLALGAVLVGVGAGGGGDAARDGSATPSTTRTAAGGSSPTATGGEVLVTVPAACGEAARNLRTATSLIDQTVGSVRDFDPERLVELLTELESLDARTRPLVSECQEVDVATATSAATGPATSTTTAGASETP